ncbi:MAG: nuclear transport factor 2 family protein [Planctomycetota bacterium]
MDTASPSTVVREFIEALDKADLTNASQLLADKVVADVTQPDVSTARLVGRDAYMTAVEALDLPGVRPSIKATQIADVSSHQAMAMIEIRAQRKGRRLHNFTAQLMTVEDGLIHRIWMVEALPAESDDFWKA